MRLRRLTFVGGFIACLLFAAAAKPAVVSTDQKTGLLLLFRGQSGQIRFINSVTGEPVVIRFRIGGLFRDFSVSTDPLTEAYYTSGTYSLSEAAATEATAALRFCSIGGMSLRLGFYDIEVREECLEVRLLWTI
ncbi:MAG: hypothetical protein MUF67_13110 [Desulfobacterales bacterium]|jgi:hypothetical protein|nr:hypothetical protein [Desulfobacterales bacterium]MCU0602348.1 hypothetical protein [Desulfobacterales bacterium]